MSVFSNPGLHAMISGHDPSHQATHVANLDSNSFVIADGKKLMIVSLPSSRGSTDSHTDSDSSMSQCEMKRFFCDASLVGNIVDFHPCSGNLQSILTSKTSPDRASCMTIDCHGSVKLTQVRTCHSQREVTWNFTNTTQVCKPISNCTSGWAGVSYDSESNQLASVHYLDKFIQWIDLATQSLFRAQPTVDNPTAVLTAPSMSSTTVLAERGALSSWDPRAHENGGCHIRLQVSREPLWSIISIGNGDLAVAGADKTVYVYDTRTWKAKTKWRSPCKFDIVRLLFGTAANSSARTVGVDGVDWSESGGRGRESVGPFVYAAGWDNELLLCDLSTGNVNAGNVAKRHRKESLPNDGKPNKLHIRSKTASETPLHSGLEEHRKAASSSGAGGAAGCRDGEVDKGAGGDSNEAVPIETDSVVEGQTKEETHVTAEGGSHYLGKLKQAHTRALRAESRWLGVEIMPSSSSDNSSISDRIIGVCALGKLYVIDHAEHMIPVT